MLNFRKHLHTYYMYDPKYIMRAPPPPPPPPHMHGMPLYESCIIILLYMPIIIVTIILEFSIGLWNGFWDILLNLFNVFSLCSFNSKSCSINSLHFLSNMSSYNTSLYIFIPTPFGPCASFGDPCNTLHAAVSIVLIYLSICIIVWNM